MPSRAPIIGGLLAVVVLASLAFALVRVQADGRGEVERRFDERARVSAAMTESLFASSVGSAQELNARRYGGATVSSQDLERAAAQSQSPYLVLLHPTGKVIAATRRATPSILSRIEQRPAYFRTALTKAGYGVSDILTDSDGAASEFATAFTAADGKRRVLVSGISSKVLAGFIGGYLARIPNFENSNAYLVDSRDLIVAATLRTALPGRPLSERGLVEALKDRRKGDFEGDRFYTSEAVAGTPWRMVLTAEKRDLYDSVSGMHRVLPWLVFLLLAVAAAVSLWLLVRVVRGAAALGVVNQQLAESHHRLELRAGELARSNAELEQFASVASHDLQEPLRKVQAFGEQLETKYASVLPEDGLDHLRRMRSASARMQGLIDDLLSFARVTTRAQPFERVDLGAIAQEVAADLEVHVEALGADLEIGPLPRIEADPLQMRQLLQNLLANALKFHRTDVAPRVRVEGDERAGAAVITVSDNGIGFENRHRERIFRVFERLHGRTSYDGTGIGLALCRRIVERHGGTISARGVAGEGATFTVVLPLEHVDAGPPEAVGPPQAAVEERKEPAHVG